DDAIASHAGRRAPGVAGGEIHEAFGADAGVVDDRESHQVADADVRLARAKEQRIPAMPVPHHVVHAAAAVFETAIPDPDIHRIPAGGHDTGLALVELTAQDFVLSLARVLLASKKKSGFDVAED